MNIPKIKMNITRGFSRNYDPGYRAHHKVKLIRGGKDYFDQMLQLINQAKETIHIQIYIFDDDDTGRLIGEALKKAAGRGVNVYLLCDGYASNAISQSFINDIRAAGVHFRFFEPIIKSKHFYFGRRLHHKLVVTDTRFAMTGGINITNRYNNRPGYTAWLDFAVFVEGDIVKDLCELCWKTWNGFPLKIKPAPCPQQQTPFEISNGATSLVRMRRNDWVLNIKQISRTYIEMLQYAQSHIVILCSYFLPGKTFRKQLALAAKRGVKIKIILAGLSDVKVAKFAEKYIYDWLLRNNIAIYEYQGNMLHGKIAACDTEWVTIGSYNINNISARASIELNLDIRDASFTANVESVFEGIIEKECVQITREIYAQSSSLLSRLLWWISYQTVKGLIYLFTFYFRQRN